MVVILISYMTKVPAPPPSLRDTSASGGHVMAIFAIATQSPGGGVGYRHVLLWMQLGIKWAQWTRGCNPLF